MLESTVYSGCIVHIRTVCVRACVYISYCMFKALLITGWEGVTTATLFPPPPWPRLWALFKKTPKKKAAAESPRRVCASTIANVGWVNNRLLNSCNYVHTCVMLCLRVRRFQCESEGIQIRYFFFNFDLSSNLICVSSLTCFCMLFNQLKMAKVSNCSSQGNMWTYDENFY